MKLLKQLAVVGVLTIAADVRASVYECRSAIGPSISLPHTVDTSLHLQYMWMFRAYPEAQSWCGTARGSTKLTCEIRDSVSGVYKVYATIEIQAGDQGLTLVTPECGKAQPCKIECTLSSP